MNGSLALPGNCSDLRACIRAIVDEALLASNGNQTVVYGSGEGYYDDSSNSYKYIVFVLVVYAVSFMSLMVKYFWRSHESKKFENLYEDFVKRDSFRGKMQKDRNAQEKRGLARQIPLASIGIAAMPLVAADGSGGVRAKIRSAVAAAGDGIAEEDEGGEVADRRNM